MNKIILSIFSALAILACNKNNDLSNPEAEAWKVVFSEITEPIFDSRVNGDEFHIITNDYFYRIRGENILEKRPLPEDKYHNYSSPIIGHNLIFRLINFDTVAFLEFQPIKPGGNVMRLSYDELGDDKLTFPITNGFGGRHTGRFDDQNNFLFVGFDYPSFQQFSTMLKIDYDSSANTIHQIQIIKRTNLNPTQTMYDGASRAEDVLETDGLFFISVGDGGHYRFTNDSFDYFPDIPLSSIVKENSIYYGSSLHSGLITSSDMGITWMPTNLKLQSGWILLKEGEFYIESNNNNQIFRTGEKIDDLVPFSFPPYKVVPFRFAEIKYYDGNYYLYGNIEGSNLIFRRSTLL